MVNVNASVLVTHWADSRNNMRNFVRLAGEDIARVTLTAGVTLQSPAATGNIFHHNDMLNVFSVVLLVTALRESALLSIILTHGLKLTRNFE